MGGKSQTTTKICILEITQFPPKNTRFQLIIYRSKEIMIMIMYSLNLGYGKSKFCSKNKPMDILAH